MAYALSPRRLPPTRSPLLLSPFHPLQCERLEHVANHPVYELEGFGDEYRLRAQVRVVRLVAAFFEGLVGADVVVGGASKRRRNWISDAAIYRQSIVLLLVPFGKDDSGARVDNVVRTAAVLGGSFS